MTKHKLFKNLITKYFLIGCSLLLISCTPHSKIQSKSNTSYYPYLTDTQYEFLHRQNTISIVPETVTIPSHEIGTLEYEFNAENWWGSWPQERVFFNTFVAEHAKKTLGCRPQKEKTTFTLPAGIYTYKKQKVSLSVSLSWKLTTNIESICQTKTALPKSYYENESIYWSLPYSQNRIVAS